MFIISILISHFDLFIYAKLQTNDKQIQEDTCISRKKYKLLDRISIAVSNTHWIFNLDKTDWDWKKEIFRRKKIYYSVFEFYFERLLLLLLSNEHLRFINKFKINLE